MLTDEQRKLNLEYYHRNSVRINKMARSDWTCTICNIIISKQHKCRHERSSYHIVNVAKSQN